MNSVTAAKKPNEPFAEYIVGYVHCNTDSFFFLRLSIWRLAATCEPLYYFTAATFTADSE